MSEPCTASSGSTGTLTLEKLNALAAKFPPVVQRFWLHDHGQLAAIRNATEPKNIGPRSIPEIALGPQLIVDPEQNPIPDMILADYRSHQQMTEDESNGLTALEVLTR